MPAHPLGKRLVVDQQRRIVPARRKTTGLDLGRDV
jgi:hypothetical protein